MSASNELKGDCYNFHKPGENYKTAGYVVTKNTENLLKEHLSQTGGKVVTRFPPEPNGVLHIGHAKAINFNFGYARKNDGYTYLRYDDTNPEKEEEKFFNNILDMVTWLGFKPYKITYASDNFQKLYELAKKLIKINKAYICHQTVEQIRGIKTEFSPWRERPIEESLQLFEDMKNGKVEEGKAILRMKMIMDDGKVDPVAYRIKFVPHHRTGNDWCIYPTYDYTHCLCDSIENISHSLCTKEFQNRRSAYYWLCNALDVYCPVQWEYGRMNIYRTVLSKRKILKLVDQGIVRGWDDPRLYTLSALRRRGFPPQAINQFCENIGVTMSQSNLEPAMLESCVRDYLNINAPRTMAVLSPLKVIIQNWPSDIPSELEVADFPNRDNSKCHKIQTAAELYIEESDFSDDPGKGYRRLTPNQPVGLRYIGLVIQLEDIVNPDTPDRSLKVKCFKVGSEDCPKPRAFIHWVAKPVHIEVRNYSALFTAQVPDEYPNGGFMGCVNKDSLSVNDSVMVDMYLGRLPNYTQVQFERVGYYAVDEDSSDAKVVWNKVVGLKEDSGKKADS